MRPGGRGSLGVRGAAAAILAITLGLAGSAQSTDDARTRADFVRMIDRPRVPPAPLVAVLPARGRFVEEHFTYASESGERVPGIAIKRAGPAGRRAVVIALHGTGERKDSMVPLLQVLAERGFLAVAIDGRYHGERAKSSSDYPAAILRAYRSGHGHPFLYDTVWDAMRLVDYLDTRPDVDPARIGMMGISKGGIETYLTAAADPRIAVAVPVIGVQSFRWALEHDAWQARAGTIQPAVEAAASDAGVKGVNAPFVRKFYDRVVPGIYGEFDGPAMLALIAPRPLLVINGDQDMLTPLAGVQESAAAAAQAYRLAHAQEKFELFVQPDAGHEFTRHAQEATVDWFVRWLRP
jgi:dienelactone hydrolase